MQHRALSEVALACPNSPSCCLFLTTLMMMTVHFPSLAAHNNHSPSIPPPPFLFPAASKIKWNQTRMATTQTNRARENHLKINGAGGQSGRNLQTPFLSCQHTLKELLFFCIAGSRLCLDFIYIYASLNYYIYTWILCSLLNLIN